MSHSHPRSKIIWAACCWRLGEKIPPVWMLLSHFCPRTCLWPWAYLRSFFSAVAISRSLKDSKNGLSTCGASPQALPTSNCFQFRAFQLGMVCQSGNPMDLSSEYLPSLPWNSCKILVPAKSTNHCMKNNLFLFALNLVMELRGPATWSSTAALIVLHTHSVCEIKSAGHA